MQIGISEVFNGVSNDLYRDWCVSGKACSFADFLASLYNEIITNNHYTWLVIDSPFDQIANEIIEQIQ